ncbi:hypothetical protein GCM10028824_26480 [Hymenobacter segetis]|uniref:Uncharacterized protein n=1 Tax=Hymenobacter segetis TaxID=2025509 RepID=A0ABU9LVN2_9BACT
MYYFAGDEAAFLTQGKAMGLHGLDIRKGLCMLGPVGKTMLLKMFSANPIRGYRMTSDEAVESAYRAGEESRKQQQALGRGDGRHLCIDDVCTEEAVVKDYGNADAPMAKVLLTGRWPTTTRLATCGPG